MTAALDPITLEVITEQLIAVVREMRATMIRTAYSMTIYEMKDFSCSLFDSAKRLVAQSEDLPAHVLPLPWSVEAIMQDFAKDINPGDVFLMNDAYRGGTHLNDVTMLYPIYDGDTLVLLAANRSHWDDVGGMTPGSMSGNATEVLQEGVRSPLRQHACARGAAGRLPCHARNVPGSGAAGARAMASLRPRYGNEVYRA